VSSSSVAIVFFILVHVPSFSCKCRAHCSLLLQVLCTSFILGQMLCTLSFIVAVHIVLHCCKCKVMRVGQCEVNTKIHSTYRVTICGDPSRNMWWPTLHFLHKPKKFFYGNEKWVFVLVGEGHEVGRKWVK